MSIAIILLNYKKADEIISQIDKIKKLKYGGAIEIVVIDNASKDGSYALLKGKLGDQKYVTLIESKENGGYAKGNNIGLRYAFEKGFDYSLVLNSDIDFPDLMVIKEMAKVIKKRDNLAAVSPVIKGIDGYDYNPEIIRPSVWDMTLGMNAYKKKGRRISKADKEKGYAYCYRPQGCCMLVDNKKIAEIGYLDENTFLYYEESILAERLIKKGYRAAVSLNTEVVHLHDANAIKNMKLSKRFVYQKQYGKSFEYYLRKYRHFSLAERIICQLFLQIKLLILSR